MNYTFDHYFESRLALNLYANRIQIVHKCLHDGILTKYKNESTLHPIFIFYLGRKLFFAALRENVHSI